MVISKHPYRSFLIQVLTACFLASQLQAASIPFLGNSGKRHTAHAAPKAKTVKTGKKTTAARTSRSAAKKRKNAKAVVISRKIREQIRSAISRAFVDPACHPGDQISQAITSKSVMILDARTGEPIYAQEADTPRQPASTIKVLTGMIALKRLEENEKVPVSLHAEAMPRSKIYLNSGEQYKADDLINAVLLESANDASVALAEKIAGSESAFANLMTIHARLWGAENTICRTASGLTAPGQQTTARDLAQIFRYAMQNRSFSERMRLTEISTSYGKLLKNHNKALWQVEGAMGGKTGYTNVARQTYVGQFKRGNDTIVVAIMGSSTMWRDIRRLVDYGFAKKEQSRVARLADRQTAAPFEVH